MTTPQTIALAWLVLQVPLGVLIGKFIAGGK